MKTPLGSATIFLLLLLLAIESYYSILPISAERSAAMMGTTVRVKVQGPGASHWAQRALGEMHRLDKLLSNFNPQSEISLINQLAGKAPLQVSPDTKACLELAEKVKRLSGGAFDICWSGKIDLGGIGKGYAVEAARRLLVKKRVRSAIIDAHSSIAVIGDGWRIGVRDPRDKEKLLGVVVLNDGEALSTSAQYEQPGHIIDPRAGKPADKCLSVTVVAEDAALTDALSTAVFVLGPEAGMALVKRLGGRALIIDKNGMIYDNLGLKLR